MRSFDEYANEYKTARMALFEKPEAPTTPEKR